MLYVLLLIRIVAMGQVLLRGCHWKKWNLVEGCIISLKALQKHVPPAGNTYHIKVALWMAHIVAELQLCGKLCAHPLNSLTLIQRRLKFPTPVMLRPVTHVLAVDLFDVLNVKVEERSDVQVAMEVEGVQFIIMEDLREETAHGVMGVAVKGVLDAVVMAVSGVLLVKVIQS